MKKDWPLILPKAILFDMDGTLTVPLIDFDALKKAMGIPNQPILETLKAMDERDRQAAEAILHEYEDRAAMGSTLNPGCSELLDWLSEVGIATALVTRNSRRSVATVFQKHGLHFDVCITREDEKFKPDPAPLQLACQRLHVSKEQAWMVGDTHHDVDAGTAAEIRTVWISHGNVRNFSNDPWHTVRDLLELTSLLRGCLMNQGSI